jgi:hypothetical protein
LNSMTFLLPKDWWFRDMDQNGRRHCVHANTVKLVLNFARQVVFRTGKIFVVPDYNCHVHQLSMFATLCDIAVVFADNWVQMQCGMLHAAWPYGTGCRDARRGCACCQAPGGCLQCAVLPSDIT